MKEVTKMELSKQIKKYRTEANLSQEELADKFMFQDKLYQIGKMKKIILILKV